MWNGFARLWGVAGRRGAARECRPPRHPDCWKARDACKSNLKVRSHSYFFDRFGLCCSIAVTDSPCESSLLVRLHEQTEAPDLPHHELLGERVMSRYFDRQVAELQIRAAVLKRFTALGTPLTQRAG